MGPEGRGTVIGRKGKFDTWPLKKVNRWEKVGRLANSLTKRELVGGGRQKCREKSERSHFKEVQRREGDEKEKGK